MGMDRHLPGAAGSCALARVAYYSDSMKPQLWLRPHRELPGRRRMAHCIAITAMPRRSFRLSVFNPARHPRQRSPPPPGARSWPVPAGSAARARRRSAAGTPAARCRTPGTMPPAKATVRRWLSVISITITAAVIGACTTPEKYATMPSNTTAPSGADGMRCDSHSPEAGAHRQRRREDAAGNAADVRNHGGGEFQHHVGTAGSVVVPLHHAARLLVAGAVGLAARDHADRGQRQPAQRGEHHRIAHQPGARTGPAEPPANRTSAALNNPPASPPARLHNTTAIQPRPKSSTAEVWPK